MKKLNKTEHFQKIILENKGILYKVINIYCKDPEDKKDLEQEILIQLWKAMDSYNGDYKLSTWIYRIAMNVSISFYRKNKKKSDHVPLDSIFVEKETTSENHEANSQLINSFLGQLNDYDKAIMLLYLEDYSYKEISNVIGISETNVGSKINRIKNKLKKTHKDGIERV